MNFNVVPNSNPSGIKHFVPGISAPYIFMSFKGALSRYFRVFMGNLSLLTSVILENGNVEFLY